MQGPVKSVIAGIASGVVTFFVSIQAMGYTSAFVMPPGASLAAWDAFVVLGLGATLVALVVHLVALRMSRAAAPLALASFFATTCLAMALAGLLGFGAKTLAAWLVGAFLASLAHRKGWPDKAFKPASLREAA
jgi:hypothetical protein